MNKTTVCVWLLWQNTVVWVGSDPTIMAAKIVERHESQEQCDVAAVQRRLFRNPLIQQRGEQVVIPVYACLPAGAPPERAMFE